MARSGSHLQSGSRAMRIMPLSRLFLSARKGAAIFTDTELVGSVDCDLRGQRTAPEIVTSSGSSFDGPALRQVYNASATAVAIPFDYPDKVVDKVVSPSRRWLPYRL